MAFDFQFVGGHGQAEQFHTAGGSRDQARKHADRGGFTGAIGAQKTKERSARDGERKTVNRSPAVINLAQIANGDGGRIRSHQLNMVANRR